MSKDKAFQELIDNLPEPDSAFQSRMDIAQQQAVEATIRAKQFFTMRHEPGGPFGYRALCKQEVWSARLARGRAAFYRNKLVQRKQG